MGNLQRRLIAFDLDGTLVDSRQDLADAANELIVEQGGTALTTEAIAAMVGEGAGVLVQRVLVASGLPASPSALPRFLAIYDARLLNHTVLYPGIVELLTTARAVGEVAVLTNKPLAPTERILEALGVREFIDQVIGGDGPHPRKPDPAGLVALMESAGADASTTLMVGDSEIDLETARRAQAASCLVTYGFRRQNVAAGPREWVVDTAQEAADVVRRFADASGGVSHVDEQL